VQRLRSSGISFRSVRGRSWRAETLGSYEVSTHKGSDTLEVEVRLPDGSEWGASLYTPEGVRRVLDEWRERDGSSGLYFWAPGVLIVRDLDRSSAVALVDDLIAEGEFQKAFVQLDQGQDPI